MGDNPVPLGYVNFNAPLPDSGHAYRECLTYILLLFRVTEANDPQDGLRFSRAPNLQRFWVVKWTCWGAAFSSFTRFIGISRIKNRPAKGEIRKIDEEKGDIWKTDDAKGEMRSAEQNNQSINIGPGSPTILFSSVI